MIFDVKKVKNCIGYLMLIASAWAVIMMLCQAVASDIWYDEVFSVDFMNRSFGDIVALTSRDVHPPFYYFYLKVFVGVFGGLFGKVSPIVIAKYASALPWLVLFITSITYIRKKWGAFVMGLYMLLVTTMPQIGNYYVEIRMYSLALMMITLSGMLALSIVEDEKKKWRWYAFFILGILTAYTQYYACIAIVALYVALFVMFVIFKRGSCKSAILGLFGCAFASVVLYLPWLPVLLSQSKTVGASYWIQPLSLRSLAGCVKYIMLPVSYDGKICTVVCILCILACLLTLILLFVQGIGREDVKILIIGLTPIVLVVLTGIILSMAGTPIFVYRYLIPTLGLLWFAFAVIIDKISSNKSWLLALIIPFILNGIFTCRGFYAEEHKKVVQMEEVSAAFSYLPKDAVIVANFDHVAAISGYYLDNKIYLYNGTIDGLIPDMLHGTGECIDMNGVSDLLSSGKDVYFFGSFNQREDILAEWSEIGINNQEIASILCERYWFNIYRLGK